MTKYLLAIGLVLALLAAWILVQRAARRYSEHHPEFGPHREEGASCCGRCAAPERGSGCRSPQEQGSHPVPGENA